MQYNDYHSGGRASNRNKPWHSDVHKYVLWQVLRAQLGATLGKWIFRPFGTSKKFSKTIENRTYVVFPSINAYWAIEILPSECPKYSKIYFFVFYVKNKVDSMPLASSYDPYLLLSLLSKFRQFFRKIAVFEQNHQKFICGAGLPNIKTTIAAVVRRIGSNPGTRMCTLMFFDCFEELSSGRHSENEFFGQVAHPRNT